MLSLLILRIRIGILNKCIPDLSAPEQLKVVDWMLYMVRWDSYIKQPNKPGPGELFIGWIWQSGSSFDVSMQFS